MDNHFKHTDLTIGDQYKSKKGNLKVKISGFDKRDRFGRTGEDAEPQDCFLVEALNNFQDVKKGEELPFTDKQQFLNRYEKI